MGFLQDNNKGAQGDYKADGQKTSSLEIRGRETKESGQWQTSLVEHLDKAKQKSAELRTDGVAAPFLSCGFFFFLLMKSLKPAQATGLSCRKQKLKVKDSEETELTALRPAQTPCTAQEAARGSLLFLLDRSPGQVMNC